MSARSRGATARTTGRACYKCPMRDRRRAPLPGRPVLAAAAASLAVLGVVAARRRLLLIEVVGDSMSPTYRTGDRLLVRRTHRFRTGDVVIARHQAGGRPDARTEPLATAWLVKRLVALPGDPVPESVRPVVTDPTVPPGSCVLLGDHPQSGDSRIWGLVPMADLGGVALVRVGTSPLDRPPGSPPARAPATLSASPWSGIGGAKNRRGPRTASR